jgi:uncharacterized membrane protein
LSAEASHTSSLDQISGLIIDYVSFGIDIGSAFIIGVSVVLAFIGYVKTLSHVRKGEGGPSREAVRFRLAGGLLLALDFQVGSDILKTVLVPTTTELIILAVIVALRIVLGWSLSKEITGHSEGLLTK